MAMSDKQLIALAGKAAREPLNGCAEGGHPARDAVIAEVHRRTRWRPGNTVIHKNIEWGIVTLGVREVNGRAKIVAKAVRKSNGRWLRRAVWLPFDLPTKC